MEKAKFLEALVSDPTPRHPTLLEEFVIPDHRKLDSETSLQLEFYEEKHLLFQNGEAFVIQGPVSKSRSQDIGFNLSRIQDQNFTTDLSSLNQNQLIVSVSQLSKEVDDGNVDQRLGGGGKLNTEKILPKAKKIRCDFCSYQTSRRSHLNEHTRNIHLKLKTVCDLCGKEFSNINQHMRVVHKVLRSGINSKKQCDECHKEYYDITKHMAKAHELKYVHEFSCQQCNIKFKSRYSMNRHFTRKHTQKGECGECGKKVANLNIHIAKVHQNQALAYGCPVCCRVFRKKGALDRHSPYCAEKAELRGGGGPCSYTVITSTCNPGEYTVEETETERSHTVIIGERKRDCTYSILAADTSPGLTAQVKPERSFSVLDTGLSQRMDCDTKSGVAMCLDPADLHSGLETSADLHSGLETSADLHSGLETSSDLHSGLETSADLHRGLETSTDLHSGLETSADLHSELETSSDLHSGLETSADLHISVETSADLHSGLETSADLHSGLETSDDLHSGLETSADLQEHLQLGLGASVITNVTDFTKVEKLEVEPLLLRVGSNTEEQLRFETPLLFSGYSTLVNLPNKENSPRLFVNLSDKENSPRLFQPGGQIRLDSLNLLESDSQNFMECTGLDEDVIEDMKRMVKKGRNNRMVLCRDCPAPRLVRNLKKHKEKFHTEKPKKFKESTRYQCELCGYKTDRVTNYSFHVKTVHLKARTICHLCGKEYSNINQHMRVIHKLPKSGLKVKEMCTLCSQEYYDIKQHLRRAHKIVQAAVKNTTCEYCKEKFSKYSNMLRHIKRAHQGWKEQCPICLKQVSNITKHRRTHKDIMFSVSGVSGSITQLVISQSPQPVSTEERLQELNQLSSTGHMVQSNRNQLTTAEQLIQPARSQLNSADQLMQPNTNQLIEPINGITAGDALHLVARQGLTSTQLVASYTTAGGQLVLDADNSTGHIVITRRGVAQEPKLSAQLDMMPTHYRGLTVNHEPTTQLTATPSHSTAFTATPTHSTTFTSTPTHSTAFIVTHSTRLMQQQATQLNLPPAHSAALSVPPDHAAQLSISDAPAQLSISDAQAQLSISDAQAQLSISDEQVQLSISDAQSQLSTSDAQAQLSISDVQAQLSISDAQAQSTGLQGQEGSASTQGLSWRREEPTHMKVTPVPSTGVNDNPTHILS